MKLSTSKDSEIGLDGLPSNPVSTLADLEVKAYENRLRERLVAKCSTHTPGEARWLEKCLGDRITTEKSGEDTRRVGLDKLFKRKNFTNPTRAISRVGFFNFKGLRDS